MVLVAVQVSVLGLYLPPVFRKPPLLGSYRHPRRSFHCRSTLPCDGPGQRARWWYWWLSNYPCRDCIARRCSERLMSSSPPQTIISVPVQTAVGPSRLVGALVVLVAVQLSCWDCISRRC